jgi:signal transduction histidine kinase
MQQFDGNNTDAFSILAHDVKTPITSIRMTLHMLLEEKIGGLTADQRELVEAACEDCEHLLAVMPSLLELARFQNNCIKMKLQPISPMVLLREAESRHVGHFQGDAALIALAPISKGERVPLVEADAIHVARVLDNFISNAAKSHVGSAPVFLSAVDRDDFVRLSVRNRIDWPVPAIEQARPSNSHSHRKGEGPEAASLGLKICREIARLHGGSIGFGSEGDCEEFYIDLRRSS